MDAGTLENYISRYGWTFEKFNEAIITGVQTSAGNILITFQLASPWLRLSAPILAPGKDRSNIFYTMLLELNDRSRMARFALRDTGDVMLCVDLYTDPPPTFEQFGLALDVLVYYAENALPHLQADTGDGEEEDQA